MLPKCHEMFLLQVSLHRGLGDLLREPGPARGCCTKCRALLWLWRHPGCKSAGRESWEPLQGGWMGTHPARPDTACGRARTGGMRAGNGDGTGDGNRGWIRAGTMGAHDAVGSEGIPEPQGPSRPVEGSEGSGCFLILQEFGSVGRAGFCVPPLSLSLSGDFLHSAFDLPPCLPRAGRAGRG